MIDSNNASGFRLGAVHIFASISLLVGVGHTPAAEVTLTPQKDNTLIESADGSLSNGAGEHVHVGRNLQGAGADRRRGVMAFDIAAAIPAGSTINNVTLTLSMSRTQAGPKLVGLHRALGDWGEGSSDAPGNEGSGTPATPGDATWLHTFYDTAFWAGPGGEFEPAPSATTMVDQIGFYQWTSAQMTAEVQTWLDDPAVNFGWVIVGDESSGQTAKRFDSRQNLLAANRPRLVVDFTPLPVPGACCFADETCQMLTGGDCLTAGGTFQGPDTVCDPNPCLPPTGACCLGGGTCDDLTQNECSAQGGLYQGDGINCAQITCPGEAIAMIAPLRDNTLYEISSGDLSNGAGEHLFAGRTASGAGFDLRRGLMAFDIAGALPAGSTITDVSLTLHMSMTIAGNVPVSVHRALSDWGEGASDGAGGEGGGAPAQPDDATWLYTFYDTALWGLPGGDFATTASAGTMVADFGFYEWSAPQMASDVQSWLDNPAQNFGWLLVGDESAAPPTAKRFDSRENIDPALRPLLTVQYLPPPVMGACCFNDGSCLELDQIDCLVQGGDFQGEATSCVPNFCPQPTGACCLGESCAELTVDECADQSGRYLGDNTACTPNPCIDPLGACCLSGGFCQEVTLDACDQAGGTYQGDGSGCTPNPCPLNLEPFVDALPIPAVAQPVSGVISGPAHYTLDMTEFQQQLHRDLPPTTVWGYGGSYPGPTIEARRGDQVTVEWINDLRDTDGNLRTEHYLPVDLCPHGAQNSAKTVVHLHGAHVQPQSDGYPEDTFLPGGSDLYLYPNNQRPSTLWYHDHALGITRLNVYMGLAGFYIVRDEVEDLLNLPSGEFEIPLVIQDRSFHPDGSLKYPAQWQDHYFGDTVLVNGKVAPSLEVARGKYRFRMLNGSNSRTYTLSLSNGATFMQIGTDGGLLRDAVALTEITLAPAERAGLVIDFELYPPGTEIILTNSAPAPFPGQPGVGVVPNVMKFVVQVQMGDTTPLPAALSPLEELQESDAVEFRDFVLRKHPDPCAGFTWLINGLKWDDITELPELGSTEVWRFINQSGMVHPMHMHLIFFQILDRQPFEIIDEQIVPIGEPIPPEPGEAGWKDTVAVYPQEMVRVIARFEGFTGKFPYHCHVLEHEDHEMMRQFQVVLPCPTDVNSDRLVNAADLAVLLGAWGINPGHPADFDGNNAVNAGDLAQLLGTWGACPGECETSAECDDGMDCNGVESCIDGLCILGVAPDCDDGDPCTIDSCDPASGCIAEPLSCPQGEACIDGQCVPGEPCGSPAECDDGDACTVDDCVQDFCQHDPLDCDDGVDCTEDSCDPVLGCSNVPNDALCDDLDVCNGAETCNPVLDCRAGIPLDCDDSDACTADDCDTLSGCTNDPMTCIDLDPCTEDGCDPASGCIFPPVDCDDLDTCTVDSCNPANGQCLNEPIDCDDSDLCTVDGCDSLIGCTHDPVDCDDADPCTTNDCDPASGDCLNDPVDCDDADPCTVDSCDPIAGCKHEPVNCDDSDNCTIDSCDPVIGCINEEIQCSGNKICIEGVCVPCNAGNCNDFDACTIDDCELPDGCFYAAVDCDDADVCTADSCDPLTGCANDPIVDCNDMDMCTADSCDPASGDCLNQSIDCNDGDACTTDSCNSLTGCMHDPLTCDDADACTDDGCDPASGCIFTPIDCDDGDACTIDSCNVNFGCRNTPIDCPKGTICVDGECL